MLAAINGCLVTLLGFLVASHVTQDQSEPRFACRKVVLELGIVGNIGHQRLLDRQCLLVLGYGLFAPSGLSEEESDRRNGTGQLAPQTRIDWGSGGQRLVDAAALRGSTARLRFDPISEVIFATRS